MFLCILHQLGILIHRSQNKHGRRLMARDSLQDAWLLFSATIFGCHFQLSRKVHSQQQFLLGLERKSVYKASTSFLRLAIALPGFKCCDCASEVRSSAECRAQAGGQVLLREKWWCRPTLGHAFVQFMMVWQRYIEKGSRSLERRSSLASSCTGSSQATPNIMTPKVMC
jgi:hypothetical protein